MFIHLEKKPFKCEHCDRAFSDKSTLRRHMITHTGAKRFACTRCDKKFTRNEHLRQHMYIHTAEKLYRCEICNKDFRQRSTRKNHMLLHRADSAFKCDNCSASFSRQSLYDKHVVWCNSPDNMLKCPQCGKTFEDQDNLKRHLLFHTTERDFKCDHCEQSFDDQSSLRRHVFTHVETTDGDSEDDVKKHFQCAICHKDFLGKEALQEHMQLQHQATSSSGAMEQTPSVFNLVQPVTYNLNQAGGLTLDPHLQFVIHNATPTLPSNSVPTSSDSINHHHIEVSTNGNNHVETKTDGVSMLAHAVCNIGGPHDVLTVTTNTQNNHNSNDTTETVANLGADSTKIVTSNRQPLQIQLPQDTTIQPGDNQLLQVQIIRMADGNQFVQSIQAIVQGSFSFTKYSCIDRLYIEMIFLTYYLHVSHTKF